MLISGRWEPRRLIARGGVAEVYEAWDHKLKIEVVLKIPRRDVHFDSSKLIENEGKILSRMNHPYIVKLIGKGKYKGTPFVVLEKIEGTPLSKAFKPPLDPVQVIDLILEIASAIQYINSKGIAHRDLKPSNIVISPRRITIIDFSVAYPYGNEAPKAETPRYSCPEAALGYSTPSCDVYSLAALTSWLLTGNPSNHNHILGEVTRKAAEAEPGRRELSISEYLYILRRIASIGSRLVIGGRAYMLGGFRKIRIGRAMQCEIPIFDPGRYVSPVHAYIIREGEAHVLADNNSLNGVFVWRNDKYLRVKNWRLIEGDYIILCYSEKRGPYVVVRYRAY